MLTVRPHMMLLQGHAKLLLTTYFDGSVSSLPLIQELPVQRLARRFRRGRGDDIQAIQQHYRRTGCSHCRSD